MHWPKIPGNKTHSLLLFLFITCACSHREQPQLSEEEIKQTEEALIGANRLMIQKDREKIVNYINSHHLAMNESASGLWYGIGKQGAGKQVQKGSVVSLGYSLTLLDGTVCYNSDSLGLKEFIVGRGGVESGLEEGVLLLKEGARATFILPPHLAHGLVGDGNRIPARSVIVYQVDLLHVEITDNETPMH